MCYSTNVIAFFIMNTVNYTNFFEYGVDAGDAQFDRASYQYSATINLFIPIRFLGASYSTINVRK